MLKVLLSLEDIQQLCPNVTLLDVTKNAWFEVKESEKRIHGFEKLRAFNYSLSKETAAAKLTTELTTNNKESALATLSTTNDSPEDSEAVSVDCEVVSDQDRNDSPEEDYDNDLKDDPFFHTPLFTLLCKKILPSIRKTGEYYPQTEEEKRIIDEFFDKSEYSEEELQWYEQLKHLNDSHSDYPLVEATEIKYHDWKGFTVKQRGDGYISLSDMFNASNTYADYYEWFNEDEHPKELLDCLAEMFSIPATSNSLNVKAVVQFIETNNPEEVGIWGHPDLALDLSQSLDAQFAVQVTHWLTELIATGSVSINNETPEEEMSYADQLINAGKQMKQQEDLEKKRADFLENNDNLFGKMIIEQDSTSTEEVDASSVSENKPSSGLFGDLKSLLNIDSDLEAELYSALEAELDSQLEAELDSQLDPEPELEYEPEPELEPERKINFSDLKTGNPATDKKLDDLSDDILLQNYHNQWRDSGYKDREINVALTNYANLFAVQQGLITREDSPLSLGPIDEKEALERYLLKEQHIDDPWYTSYLGCVLIHLIRLKSEKINDLAA